MKCTSDQAMQVQVFGIEHAFGVAFGLHNEYELATCKDLCLHLAALHLARISAYINLSLETALMQRAHYNSGVKCVYGVMRGSYQKILS